MRLSANDESSFGQGGVRGGSRASRRGNYMKTVACLAILGSLLTASAASANDGDDFTFKLINKSTEPAIQFYTIRKDGKWSGDWLKTPILPGQTRQMNFKDPTDTRCEVRTRVVFGDASEFDTSVDYCGTTAVVVTDKNLITQ
jgi:hypothetical protein